MITDVICGIPSVTVAAVVNANKLLVWEVTDGNWNGEWDSVAQMFCGSGSNLSRPMLG